MRSNKKKQSFGTSILQYLKRRNPLHILIACLLFSASAFAQKFEAESAVLAGGATKNYSNTASGKYYVAMNDGNLTFNLNFDTTAYYNIYIQVASPNGFKANNLVIDGTSITFSTDQNSAYIHLQAASSVKLTSGAHKIEITKSWGWINIDYIELEMIDPGSRFNINTALVTPEPVDVAKRLYQFLYDNYRKKIISGVSEVTEAEWLKTNTGKYPALLDIDFIQCNRGYNWYNNNTPFDQGKAWALKKGIVAFQWHWRDPSRLTEGFYTKDTNFDITKIFDETSPEYKAMISDMDWISGQLKRFQDAGIPVIWRPLHEAAGGWFWWGAKGPEACKKLWQVMFDRMVNVNGVHNLIWVWTHEPGDDAWYPGDEYVDIVGRDIYKTGDHSSQILEFNDMTSRYGGKKMVTISESGSYPDVDNLIADGAGWSWFMVWNGDFVQSSTYNSLDLWKKMFASDYVITLDEMPDIKTYVTPGSTTGMKTPEENTFKVFPTAFNDYFRVQSEQVLKSVSVYNLLGIKVEEANPDASNAVISLSGFPSGMYLVKADDNPVIKVFKK
jgi:mannan endo-1,4-beta-mannosidase